MKPSTYLSVYLPESLNCHELRTRYAVRATTDKEVLGGNESYENFHPNFTYPVCSNPIEVSRHHFADLDSDIRRRGENIWIH